MPFNNYAPQYIFKGQVQSETAPSANNDLVRKQDVSGLSFISSIASGSSSYLSVDASGELSVSSLLISDVHVDNSQTSLANFISNEGSTAASLKKGDFLVLTAATGGAETYIVSGADGSVAGNYTQVESGLTSAEIVAKLSAGAGINISAGGQISSTITQYTDTNARASLSGGAGISYNSTTGQISSTITQYTDTNARAAVSAENNAGLAYSSATGKFRVSLDAAGGLSFNGASIQISADGIKDSMIDFGTGAGQVSTADLPEQTNLYFTDTRARAAISATGNISYNSSTGQISTSLTQYTDSNARAALSGGNGLDYNSSTGAFDLDLAANKGLEIVGTELAIKNGPGIVFDAGDGSVTIENNYFRKEFASQNFTANSAKTINHGLGQKFVHVSVYDSNDDLIHAAVSLTDANNLTITLSDALTGATVLVSI